MSEGCFVTSVDGPRNMSLPDDLDERARNEGLNVSALARRAVAEELDRRSRMTDGRVPELASWDPGDPHFPDLTAGTGRLLAEQIAEPARGAHRAA